jgi:predicted transcriptional regulator
MGFFCLLQRFFFVIIKSAEGQSGLLIKKSNKKIVGTSYTRASMWEAFTFDFIL